MGGSYWTVDGLAGVNGKSKFPAPYDAETGTVIYRSKMHAGLKRNFQVMPGAEWLELLCRHIPDRYEHLVRYVGWYSNRARGERARALKVKELATKPSTEAEPVSAFGARVKASWARLIRCTRQIRSNGRLWPKADARKA
ncbi:MAG TPA: transposase [Burkholderiales bacterium]|nr:transposase [Burkholderiales bacterium]